MARHAAPDRRPIGSGPVPVDHLGGILADHPVTRSAVRSRSGSVGRTNEGRRDDDSRKSGDECTHDFLLLPCCYAPTVGRPRSTQRQVIVKGILSADEALTSALILRGAVRRVSKHEGACSATAGVRRWRDAAADVCPSSLSRVAGGPAIGCVADAIFSL